MRRDMDLIRLVLLDAEGEEPVDFSPFSNDQVSYHRKLLYDAGYIKGIAADGGTRFLETDLTWDGHEFLADARNDNVWNETKAQLTKRNLVTASMDVFKSVLTAVAVELATRGLT